MANIPNSIRYHFSCTPCTACWKSYLQKNFPDDRKSQKTFPPDELSKKQNTPLTIETPPHNTHKTPHKKRRSLHTMKGLTSKQQSIVEFIENFTAAMEMAPTIYEIAEHFGIKTSTVFAHIRALQKKNILHRSSKARSIALAKTHKKSKMPAGVQTIPMMESADPGAKSDFIFDDRVFPHSGKSSKGVFAVHLGKSDVLPHGFKAGDILLIRNIPSDDISHGDLLLTEKNGNPTFCNCISCKNGICEMEPLNTQNKEHIFKKLTDPAFKGVVFGAVSHLKD